MPSKDLSTAAKIYLLSGKIPHLTEGFCFTKSPTGEMVNTQHLAEAMILATLLELVREKKLEMKDESKKVLFMMAPIITLKRLATGGIGLGKAILDRLDQEKKLTDVVVEIVGGVWLIPHYSILGLVNKEMTGLFKEVEVKKMFGASSREKIWEKKKVDELIKAYEKETQKAFQETLDMPLRTMSLSSLHIAWGLTTKKEKKDRDD